MSRSDLHRPSKIVPSDYSEACFVVQLQNEARAAGKRIFGNPGRCGQCGTHFTYGCIWRHEPTGDLVHMGHTCSATLELFADWSQVELEKARRAAARKAMLATLKNDGREAAFARACPYMAGVFAWAKANLDDRQNGRDAGIIWSMRGKVREWGQLSDKAIDYACQLFVRATSPVPGHALEIPCPTGKDILIEGEVVSLKWRDSGYGRYSGSIKMVVKVQTEAGSYCVWGTAPAKLVNDDHPLAKGDRIRFIAGQVQLPRDEDGNDEEGGSFGFCKSLKKPVFVHRATPAPATKPADPAQGEDKLDPFAEFAA